MVFVDLQYHGYNILGYCKRGLYSQAQERLSAAVERATRNYTRPKDGEAFYYLGIAQRATGMHDAARDAFHKATWSFAWSAASNLALAEVLVVEGIWREHWSSWDDPSTVMRVMREL